MAASNAEADAEAGAMPPQEAVGPLVRGLTALRCLAEAEGRLPVSELARASGLARSTVDRIVNTLSCVGYLRTEGRDAVLTSRLMEVGNAYLTACRFPELLGPLAVDLADDLDESVSIAVPDGDAVRFVQQSTRRRAMSLTFRIGDLVPAERTAVGALFAVHWTGPQWAAWRLRSAADPGQATFPAVPPGYGEAAATFEARTAHAREHGWSLDDQLVEPGLIAVAAPVHGPTGELLCVVSAVSHTSRHSAESLREAVLPRLRETAAAMERALVDASPAAVTGAETSAQPAPRARAASPEPSQGPLFLESLARGLDVLTALGEGRPGLSLTAVAEATGLARATARRALITLEHLGYVASDGRLFRLTPRVLELGFAQLSGLTLAQIAQPHLVSLVHQVRESASMAVLSGEEIQYIARVPTVRIMSVNITLGTRFPAYATSLGRVLLAALPESDRAAHLARTDFEPLTRRTVTSPAALTAILRQIERDGHALVDGELEEGLRSIAVPLHDHGGRTVAAVNVSTHAGSSTVDETRINLLPRLRAAVASIEKDLHIAGRHLLIPVF